MYGYGRKYKYKPSKSEAREFALKMQETEKFCDEKNIRHSLSKDSYYFTLNGVCYRISNHTVEQSNRAAFDEDTGKQIRRLYHDEYNDEIKEVHILASKTRIIEIYEALKAGKILDGRGNEKKPKSPKNFA